MNNPLSMYACMKSLAKHAVHLHMQAHKILSKARQTRYIVSHQPFTCMRAVIIHYLLLTNAIYSKQIYGAMPIKSGCVIAWWQVSKNGPPMQNNK